MRFRKWIMILAAVLAAACALFLPAHALFTEGGFLAYGIRQPQTVQMAVEIMVVFIFFLACLLLFRGWAAITALSLGTLVFCWLHVTFLPMAVSGLYVGYLMLLGRWMRVAVFRVGGNSEKGNSDTSEKVMTVLNGLPADFLLGCGLAITLFCLLSAIGIGGIANLRAVSVVLGFIIYGWAGRGLWRTLKIREAGTNWPADSDARRIPYRLVHSALIAFILTMLLIQVGRMNITLDFDTLWYGVRSEYILDNGGGIYENPGLVGMVYVYSKGLEVLTLPLCDLASHSYLLFFNVWMTALGLMLVYGIARILMGRNYALLSAALTSAIPGIMNMAISAKPDSVTWLLQLVMIFYLLLYVRGVGDGRRTRSFFRAGVEHVGGAKERPPAHSLILAAGAYLLSLTMKPTSLVFSTAIFGMAGLYLLCSGNLRLRAPFHHWLLLLPEAAALIGIWARTMLFTGMPVTSVFTSIFARMGFQMKYPFATGSLPQNWQEESNLRVLLRRLYQILLAPEGKDMSHVILAWGTSLIFFLAVCVALLTLSDFLERDRRQARGQRGRRNNQALSVHVVFWPFLAVNLVSLVMLYQVDGNYFMLLYTMVVLAACAAFSRAGARKSRAVSLTCLALLVPLVLFNALVTMETNWAWSLGFSEIQWINKGRVNHEALQREDMIRKGNAQIWEILAEDQKNRVIAFGDHPFCLAFPCNVQSYKDVTSPWGNVELVNSAEAFEAYMEYAKTDYVYVEAGFIGESSWSWSYGLVQEMIADGALTDLLFEEGNVLARVNLQERAQTQPGDSAEPRSQDAAAYLEQFQKMYKTADPEP